MRKQIEAERDVSATTHGSLSRLPYVFVFVPFLFYTATCSRTIGLGDCAMLMEAIRQFTLGTHVNSHNLTVVFGKLVSLLPLGTSSFEANLTSAFAGASAISLFYIVIYRMTSSATTAGVVASITMVSHSMWWHSTIVESYALNALFTVIAIGLLAHLQKRHSERIMMALFFVSGLALFNHLQMGIIAIGATTYFALVYAPWSRRRPPGLVRAGHRCLLAFAAGALPFLVLFARDVAHFGLRETLWQASGGPFHSIMLKGAALSGAHDTAFLTALQFPSVFLVAVAYGATKLARAWGASASFFALLVILLVNTSFFMTYNTWDKFAFMLPSFIIMAFAATFVVYDVVRWATESPSRAALISSVTAIAMATPIFLYAQLSTWGKTPGFWYPRYNNEYTINTHDCAEFIANPNKHGYADITTFADHLFSKLPAGAVFVDSDSRTFYPLHYLQAYENRRPDVQLRLVNSWGFEDWGLSGQDFLQLLEGSYRDRQELFLISLDHPFAQALASEQIRGHYEFKPFPLDAHRWIYKLVIP